MGSQNDERMRKEQSSRSNNVRANTQDRPVKPAAKPHSVIEAKPSKRPIPAPRRSPERPAVKKAPEGRTAPRSTDSQIKKPIPQRNNINDNTQRKPNTAHPIPRRATSAKSTKPTHRRKKSSFKRAFHSFCRYTALFLICYVLMALIYCGATLISLKSTKSESIDKRDAVVEISPKTSTKKAVTVTYDADSSYYNGKLYLPFEFLTNYAKVVEIGDYNSRTFIINDTETVRLYIDTAKATINGTQTFLKDDVLFIDKKIYMSIDFYRDMMTGLTIKPDEATDSIYITHVSDAAITMKVRPMKTEASIAYPENTSDDNSSSDSKKSNN